MPRGWNLLELPRRISLLPKKSLSRALCPYIWEVRNISGLDFFSRIILNMQNDQIQEKPSMGFVGNHESLICFCFPAAVSAPCPTPSAESCLTLWCTSTWASAPTEQCPPTSSRSRQPLFTLIPSTHSGSSLETRTESFTWEWVLVGAGPWVDHKQHQCHQGLGVPCHHKPSKCPCERITASQNLSTLWRFILKCAFVSSLKSLLLLCLKTLHWESISILNYYIANNNQECLAILWHP